MVKYKKVRAVNRGMDILAALSQEPGASVARVSKMISVHRTTVYRILDTLEDAGYVRRSLADDCYCLTNKTRALGHGVDEDANIIDIAARHIHDITSELAWPSSVATLDGHRMFIRETTHGRSPLFVHEVHIGTETPILTTAMGRAFLGYCNDSEREMIIRMIADSDRLESSLARDDSYVDRAIRLTREQGFGCSFGESRKTLGSIALPIRIGNEVKACINIVFFRSAVPADAAIRSYLPVLARNAAAIEQGLTTH
jgi:IclR family mhp operon transcriptional activator